MGKARVERAALDTGEVRVADIRAAAFEGLPMSGAVLDPAGRIVAVNAAWRLFGELNAGAAGPALGSTGVGANYLEVCRHAAASPLDGAAEGAAAAEGLLAVSRGELSEFELEYPCASPVERRWFLLRASPLPSPHRGTAVLHLDITRRKHLEMRLEHSATHDPLTGLPNRAVLLDRLSVICSRRPRPGSESVVLFCDLDRFKAVNDSLGHTSGDEVLSMAAERIERALRAGDTLVRLGGDEFVVICEDLRPDEVDKVVARIEGAFLRPFQVGAHAPTLGVSVGWAPVRAGADPIEVVGAADTAMYERKRAGRAAG